MRRTLWALGSAIGISGCGLVLGDLDVTLGSGALIDASHEAARGDAPDVVGDGGGDGGGGGGEGGGCHDEHACDGKCGQRLDACGALAECGDCSGDLTCGGGGVANLCGLGTCTPSCAGKACGATDGCKDVCTSQTCAAGLRCVTGRCTCDSTSCTGCCAADACLAGTSVSACGAAGGACATCTPPSGGTAACDAGACTFTCDTSHPACQGGCCSVYGHAVDLGGTGTYSANELCVRPVTVTAAGTLEDVGVLSVTSGVQIALGLYTDVAGAPGTLVGQTSAAALDGGTLVLPTPARAIAAGAYWIAASFAGTATIREAPVSTVTSYCATLTFGSPLPSSFPTVGSYQGRLANLYVLVQ